MISLQGIEAKLRKQSRNLDDVQREILLQATFAMATADGHMAVWLFALYLFSSSEHLLSLSFAVRWCSHQCFGILQY